MDIPGRASGQPRGAPSPCLCPSDRVTPFKDHGTGPLASAGDSTCKETAPLELVGVAKEGCTLPAPQRSQRASGPRPQPGGETVVSRADSRGLTLEWTQQDIADRLVGTLHGALAKDESETLRLVHRAPLATTAEGLG